MVLPLGDRFESKEKLKHFDKAALEPEPRDVPVGGGLGKSRLLVGRGLSGCRWKTLRTRSSSGLPLKGVKCLLRAPSQHPPRPLQRKGEGRRFKVQAGECRGPALEVKADLLPTRSLPGVMVVGKGHACLQREEKALW